MNERGDKPIINQKFVWLLDRFQNFNDRTALIWHHHQFTYSDLLAKIQGWRDTLKELGVPSGACVAILGDYGPNTCALLLALMLDGNIAVPVSSRLSAEKQAEWFAIAEVSYCFQFDTEDDWRLHHTPRAITHPLLKQLQQDTEPGLVLFSSGSTGKSKATLLSFTRLTARLKVLRKAYSTLAFLLLDHIGGINTLLYTLSQGGTLVTIGDRTPASICKSIEEFQIQLLPTTPTFLNMLLISDHYNHYDLSSLQLISYGTEPMPLSTLQHLNRVFPQIKFKQTYGLSEVGILPVTSRTSDSLWIQLRHDGIDYKIIEGILWLRSDTAMVGYLNAPSPFDAEGWLNTGDAVEIEGEYIRVLGRQSEIINVGGEKVYPAEVEDVILRAENIQDVVVTGKLNPIMGQVVVAKVILLQSEAPKLLKKRIRKFCKQHLAPFKVPAEVQVSDQPHHSERFKKMRR